MTATGADDRGSHVGDSRSIESSTATLDEVTELLSAPIEAFRASAPLGITDGRSLAAMIAELRGWARSQQRRMGTLSDLAAGSASVALRVDVDMAIADSPALADEVLGDLSATWSVLHTASYAGYWLKGTWYRHVALAPVFARLANHGELALHVDPFGLARRTTLDPGYAVTAELDWLRNAVGPVRGVSAHDAAPVHGAENFEIFAQWALDVVGVPRAATYHEVAATLDATRLGIDWCAGAPRPGPGGAAARHYLGPAPPWPLQNGTWMRAYLHDGPYCRWFDGCDIWLIGDDSWVVSDRTNDVYLHAVDWNRVGTVLSGLDPQVVVSVCVHPVYVSGLGTTP